RRCRGNVARAPARCRWDSASLGCRLGAAVYFLAPSDESRYVTGIELVVDGALAERETVPRAADPRILHHSRGHDRSLAAGKAFLLVTTGVKPELGGSAVWTGASYQLLGDTIGWPLRDLRFRNTLWPGSRGYLRASRR